MIKKKAYLRLTIIKNILLSSFIIYFFVVGECSKDMYLAILFAVVLLMLAYQSFSAFRNLKTVSEEDLSHAPPHDATIPKKINYYKNTLRVGIPSFILLSVWAIYDLNHIDEPDTYIDHVEEMMSVLNDVGGYWIAALSIPVFGTYVSYSIYMKIKKLENENDI